MGVVVCVCVCGFLFGGGGGGGFFSHYTLLGEILCIFLCFWQTEVTLFITCHAIPILALLTPK